jgi:hypothetical protein
MRGSQTKSLAKNNLRLVGHLDEACRMRGPGDDDRSYVSIHYFGRREY